MTLTDSWSSFNLSYGVVCGVLAVGQLVVAGVRYRRSRAVELYEPVVDALVTNREAFCLILRPFGWDGEIVLPRSDRKGRVNPVNGFTPNLTLEQVIARAARATSAMPVYVRRRTWQRQRTALAGKVVSSGASSGRGRGVCDRDRRALLILVLF